MTMDICSIWAYQEIVDSGYLGDKQAEVMAEFTSDPTSHTASEIVIKLKKQGRLSENIRNRITELTKMGYLEKLDKIKCPYTDKIVNRWKWTGKKDKASKELVLKTCPLCNGAGQITSNEYKGGDKE